MSEYIPLLITVFALNMFGAISPGPDMIIVIRNSVMYSRQYGLLTAYGIVCGVLIHVTYCIFGVGLLLEHSVMAVTIIKYAGATYFMYLGGKMIFKGQILTIKDLSAPKRAMTPSRAFMQGLVTNLLNPKAVLFFLSLFTIVINPDIPKHILIVFGAEILGFAIFWFTLVAVLFSHQKVRQAFLSQAIWFEKITGMILVLLAINIVIFS